MDAREQLQTRSNIYRFLNRIEDQQSRRFANQGWLRDSITWASIAPQVVVLCDLAVHHDRYHRNTDGLRLHQTWAPYFRSMVTRHLEETAVLPSHAVDWIWHVCRSYDECPGSGRYNNAEILGRYMSQYRLQALCYVKLSWLQPGDTAGFEAGFSWDDKP
mmetsp:Transcript_63589/g.176344  ORF Transcript_63589/g.176344 Transcript_63589/m.176344 type:complete len:160 (-) Transcript_63589:586-1065(-)